MNDKTKVSVGFTTILGIVLGVLPGIITIVVKVIEEGSQVTVNGPARWLAYITIGAGGIVLIGRYLQSVVQAKQQQPEIKLIPVPHNAEPKLAPLDEARHLLTEYPEITEELKKEGVIT